MTGAAPVQVTIMQRLTLVAPFGVRFWDPVAGEPVAEDLQVTLRPALGPGMPVRAAANPGGIHVVHRLPGLARVVRGAGDTGYWTKLAERRRFIAEVVDRAGRFHPLRFEALLPARGMFVPDCAATSPPAAPARTVELYSTPLRSVPAGMAVLRAELRHSATEEPVAWALLAAEHRGVILGWGLAGRDGRVALIFPYPEPERRRILSPFEPLSPPGAVAAISWNIRLRAFHSPAVAASPVPDYCAQRCQSEALLLGRLSPPAPIPELTLTLGQPEYTATAGKNFLLLAPA